MKKKVVIVEDESIVAMEIGRYVRQLGYEVAATVRHPDQAIDVVAQQCPFAILMDVNLAGEVDGIDAAPMLQQPCQSAVIYLTAYSDEATIERAAKTNPSGYLVKPFNRKELAAALKIAQMRAKSEPETRLIALDEAYRFDPRTEELYRDDEYVHLTRRERELLALLMRHQNATVDLYTIENTIWPEKAPNENTRRALVRRLRAKLDQRFVETVPGIGYRINF